MKLIAGAWREVEWSESRDSGGMFDAEVGYWKSGDGFIPYVQDGWGAGIKGTRKMTAEEAKADIDRLWKKFFG